MQYILIGFLLLAVDQISKTVAFGYNLYSVHPVTFNETVIRSISATIGVLVLILVAKREKMLHSLRWEITLISGSLGSNFIEAFLNQKVLNIFHFATSEPWGFGTNVADLTILACMIVIITKFVISDIAYIRIMKTEYFEILNRARNKLDL